MGLVVLKVCVLYGQCLKKDNNAFFFSRSVFSWTTKQLTKSRQQKFTAFPSKFSKLRKRKFYFDSAFWHRRYCSVKKYCTLDVALVRKVPFGFWKVHGFIVFTHLSFISLIERARYKFLQGRYFNKPIAEHFSLTSCEKSLCRLHCESIVVLNCYNIQRTVWVRFRDYI